MKILACIKQVPEKDSRYEILADGSWIRDADLSFDASEPDEYGLEEALRLKEKQGGEVILLSIGPDRVEKMIRKGLAMGADRAVLARVEDRRLDAHLTARVIAAVAKQEQADLIITGIQSDDIGLVQTGVAAAEMLGWPHVTLVMGVEVLEGGKLRVQREMESGWLENSEIPLPAVLAIQSGISQIRYASLKGIMAAKKKEVRKVSADELISGDVARLAIGKVMFPPAGKKAEILPGSPKEAAAALVDKLKREAKVL